MCKLLTASLCSRIVPKSTLSRQGKANLGRRPRPRRAGGQNQFKATHVVARRPCASISMPPPRADPPRQPFPFRIATLRALSNDGINLHTQPQLAWALTHIHARDTLPPCSQLEFTSSVIDINASVNTAHTANSFHPQDPLRQLKTRQHVVRR